MTTVLGIDTASATIALALAVDGEVASEFAEDVAEDHTRTLLAQMDRMLGGWRRALAGIAVVKGPGNYAGLRVGIATAQGLAMACGAPLRGIGTLEAVALASGLGEVTAIHPAGRGEVAARLFHRGQAAGPLRAAQADDLAGLSLAGEGAGSLGGKEVGPAERCRAALLALLPLFASQTGESVEAMYLREPTITLSRRPNPALRLP